MRTSLTLLLSFALGLNLAYADTVNLHQEPKADSPTTASIDLAKGVVPIYTPANSEWIKVADPTNGNVGWIKQSDFKNANSASMSVSQEVVGADGKVNKTGYTINVGKPTDSTKMNQLQENVQHNMKVQIQDMVDGMNRLYQKQMKLLEESGFYVAPENAKAPVTSATPAPVTKTTTP